MPYSESEKPKDNTDKEFTYEEIYKRYMQLLKSYNNMLADLRCHQENTNEMGRLLGYYKIKYYEYRENLRKIADFIRQKNLQEHFKDCDVLLNPNDLPLLPMYDNTAEAIDKVKLIEKIKEDLRRAKENEQNKE